MSLTTFNAPRIGLDMQDCILSGNKVSEKNKKIKNEDCFCI
jgi:hypothetical protein